MSQFRESDYLEDSGNVGVEKRNKIKSTFVIDCEVNQKGNLDEEDNKSESAHLDEFVNDPE